MKIEIGSRESTRKRANEPFAAHTALISITGADDDFVVLRNRPEYLIQSKFNDVSFEDLDFILCRRHTEVEKLQFARINHMLNDKQAGEIAGFIKSILDKAELLICQCEHGHSRSAGVAAAVKQFLDKSGIEIFADDRYYPNKHVYRKVLEALETEI